VTISFLINILHHVVYIYKEVISISVGIFNFTNTSRTVPVLTHFPVHRLPVDLYILSSLYSRLSLFLHFLSWVILNFMSRFEVKFIDIYLHATSKNVFTYCCLRQSRDSSVGVALGYGLGFDSRRGLGIFFSHRHVQNGTGTHPASYPMSTRGSFPGSKAAGA
jgi:hypothetical protein